MSIPSRTLGVIACALLACLVLLLSPQARNDLRRETNIALYQVERDYREWLRTEEGQQAKPYIDRTVYELRAVRNFAIGTGLDLLHVVRLDPRGKGPTLFGYELWNPRRWWLWVLAVLISWSFWQKVIRIPAILLGRAFGLTAPEHFAWFLKFAVPWRSLMGPVLALHWMLRQWRYGKAATAGWMPSLYVLRQVFKRGDSVPLGRFVYKGFKGWQPIAYNGPLHVNICGPSGSGKSATLTTILGTLHSSASAFVVDCDGSIVRTIGPWLQREGHKVIVIDLNALAKGIEGIEDGGCNPLLVLLETERRQGCEAVAVAAAKIAEALIQQENNHQPLWDNGSRDLVHALCLYMWLLHRQGRLPEEKFNLVYLRHLLCRGLPSTDPEITPIVELLLQMMDVEGAEDGCGGRIASLIASTAQQVQGAFHRDGSNYFLDGAQRQTRWISLPGVSRCLEQSSFAFEDMKRSNPCVFFVAPLTDIQTIYSRFVRTITVMMAYTFENMPGLLKVPCLMCIDEAPSLGRLELLETGAPGFRKYGIRLITCFQDIPALRAAYPQTYTSILSNAGATLWIGVNDGETLAHLSKHLGKHTHRESVEGSFFLWRWLGLSRIQTRYQNTERDLMSAEQIKDFLDPDFGMGIVTGKKQSYRVALDPYWKALPVTRYEPHPFHGDAPLRAFTRSALAWLDTSPVLHLISQARAAFSRKFGQFAEGLNETMNAPSTQPMLFSSLAVFFGLIFGHGLISNPSKTAETPDLMIRGAVALGCLAGALKLTLGPAYRAASALAQGSLRISYPWNRRALRYGLGFALTPFVLWILAQGLADGIAGPMFRNAAQTGNGSILIAATLIGLASLMVLACLWPILMAGFILSGQAFYLALAIALTPIVWTARAIGLEQKVILFGQWATSFLDEENRFGEWITDVLVRRGEKLAKRLHAEREPPE